MQKTAIFAEFHTPHLNRRQARRELTAEHVSSKSRCEEGQLLIAFGQQEPMQEASRQNQIQQ